MISETLLSTLQTENANVKISKATDNDVANFNRSVNGGNMSFSRTNITVFESDEMLKVETIINKEARTYGAFAAKAKDKNLLISANAITRRLYTEDGDATHEKWQVKDITNFGESPKEIVKNLIAQRKAIKCIGIEPLYSPRFVNGEAVYSGMVKRNYPIFEVVDAQ